MAILTLTQALAYARLRAQDNDATVVDADLTTIINKWYTLWTDEIDPRITLVKTGDLSGSVSANSSNFVPTSTAYADVLQVMFVATYGSGADYHGTPMERITMADWERLYAASNTAGASTKWALERVQLDTGVSSGTVRIWVYPPPSTTSGFCGRVRKVVTLLSSGSDKMDVADADSYRIVLLAASELAFIIGKPADFIAGILSEVGDKGRVLVRRWQNIVRPRIAGAPEAV